MWRNSDKYWHACPYMPIQLFNFYPQCHWFSLFTFAVLYNLPLLVLMGTLNKIRVKTNGQSFPDKPKALCFNL